MFDLPKIAREITEHTGLPASDLRHAHMFGIALADLAATGRHQYEGADRTPVVMLRECYVAEAVAS